MNFFSHVTMGQHLYKHFTENMEIKLDKRTFVMWNVMPDLAPSLLKLSHFKKDIYDLVMEKTKYLEEYGSEMDVKEYSKQLGVLCHFMSDFFCYAHAEYFSGSKLDHARYELNMQFYGYQRKDMLGAIDLMINSSLMDNSQTLYEQINNLHDEYKTVAPSFGVDFIYSLTACVSIMKSIHNTEAVATN